QRPNLYVGWHHEWNPGSHTLLLLSRLDDTLTFADPNAKINFYRYGTFSRTPLSFAAQNFAVTNRRDFAAYTAELQQIQTWREHTFVAGARYQHGDVDMTAQVDNPFNFPTLVSAQDISTRLQRASGYIYDQWQIFDPLLLVGGIAYDWLEYPRNVDIAPIDPSLTSRSQVSPKLGFIWTPLPTTHLRGAWTRSLGGVFFDNSVRIEPVQVAGFNQAFRSLAPESVAGLVPGTSFETWSLALDHEFKATRTYVAVEADLLTSDAMRTVGIVTNAFFPVADSPSGTRQSLDFRERTLAVTLNQLVGRDWSFGARYAISDAELRGRFVDVPSSVAFVSSANQNSEAVLQQLTLAANYNHPHGFFARAESVWTQQSNRNGSAALADADFWQFNLYAGWRFWQRRAELQLGLLNVGNQDYQLNPVNLTYAQPRGREFMARLKFNF
ncbi:MAG: TonB-dependent receptor, partial [Verrucomicrobia bacterium]|nr:TonB-dependent receptor [Verrucomicrobiota bacterium]